MPTKLRSICVFCASSFGNDPAFKKSAEQVGQTLAQSDIKLVYGGGNVGLMGVVAEAALKNGGKVVGVIPQMFVDVEVAHHGLTELRVVQSMHERKAMMAELADAFIALPGGFGTLEEFFEVVTWSQLGLHQKPAGLLNIQGFYDDLLKFLNHAAVSQLIRPQHAGLILKSDSIDDLLNQMQAWKPTVKAKYIKPNQT